MIPLLLMPVSPNTALRTNRRPPGWPSLHAIFDSLDFLLVVTPPAPHPKPPKVVDLSVTPVWWSQLNSE
jgi:hypothetical protein